MRYLSTLAASLTAVLFLLTIGCPALSHSDEHEEGTNPPGDHNYFDFGIPGGGHGDDDDIPTGDDDDATGDACQEFVDTICACPGIDDYFDMLETTCEETYQELIDIGDNTACEQALEAFYAGGGCDQFTDLGDDDDTA